MTRAVIVLSYLLLAGSTTGARPWTVTSLPSVAVCGRQSSVQSASVGRIYRADYFGCDYCADGGYCAD